MTSRQRKWALVFDADRCTNCNNCVLSVLDEYTGNEFPGYAAALPTGGALWLEIKVKERGQYPVLDVACQLSTCQHCDDAPCIKAATNGAVEKRSDGLVVIHPEKAVGQKQLVAACPYGAILWNEERNLPQHWNFDAHLIDGGWTEPRCVQACPTGALSSHKLTDDELAALKDREGLQELRPELRTRSRVLYKNLNRFTKVFVAGTVVTSDANGVSDCVIGTLVQLTRRGEVVAQVHTDAFGIFKFDNLDPDQSDYQLSIEGTGVSVEPFALNESKYIGTITI